MKRGTQASSQRCAGSSSWTAVHCEQRTFNTICSTAYPAVLQAALYSKLLQRHTFTLSLCVWILQIALVLVDEVHLLNEAGRGSSLEAGCICRLKAIAALPDMAKVGAQPASLSWQIIACVWGSNKNSCRTVLT